MLHALTNARVLTPDGWRDDLAVLLDGERIVDLLPPSDPRVRAAQPHDLAGAMLLPGFIDVQVNGGGGVLFNEAPTVETIRRIGAAHRRFGTTGFLPTLISDRVEVMREALAAVEQALAEGVPGLLGIHLEGPYLADARKGVHDAKYFHAPDADERAHVVRRHHLPEESVGAAVVQRRVPVAAAVVDRRRNEEDVHRQVGIRRLQVGGHQRPAVALRIVRRGGRLVGLERGLGIKRRPLEVVPEHPRRHRQQQGGADQRQDPPPTGAWRAVSHGQR